MILCEGESGHSPTVGEICGSGLVGSGGFVEEWRDSGELWVDGGVAEVAEFLDGEYVDSTVGVLYVAELVVDCCPFVAVATQIGIHNRGHLYNIGEAV